MDSKYHPLAERTANNLVSIKNAQEWEPPTHRKQSGRS